MTTTTLATRNEAWGFFGTITHHADPKAAWDAAFQAIAAETKDTAEAIRDFLDSRAGRHFADSVAESLFQGLELEHAIEAAITEWQGWTICRRTEREYGIPRGLPYLTGWVGHSAILAKANA